MHFYPRSPCGERHFTGYVCRLLEKHFYPRSPCGERRNNPQVTMRTWRFLSTLSLRRATSKNAAIGKPTLISIHALLAESDVGRGPHAPLVRQFLSTLSLRRATHYDNYNLHCVEISIHALLAESDFDRDQQDGDWSDFYPRSPCGERRILGRRLWHLEQFLSTLSLRRATHFRGPAL